ncbi:E1-E2 ATPase family protein [Cryptosporidium felis]|nr:E1-E2 ATPase family protein [Cryptosporidium felis]
MNSLDLHVTGMTCVSCASTIRNLLMRYKYVKDVEVNILMNSVKVILNNSIALNERKRICDTISNAGFTCLLKSSTMMTDTLTLSIDESKLDEKSMGSEIVYGSSKDIAEQILNSKNVQFLKLHRIPPEEMKSIVKGLENKTGVITIISYSKWGQLCILFDENQISLTQIQEILELSGIQILSYVKFYCMFGKDKLTCVNRLRIKSEFSLNSDKPGTSTVQKTYNYLVRPSTNSNFCKDFSTSMDYIVSGLFGIYNVSVENLTKKRFSKTLHLIINIEYNPYFISGLNLLHYINEEVLSNYRVETPYFTEISQSSENFVSKTNKYYSHKLIKSEQEIAKNYLEDCINYSAMQTIKDRESRYFIVCFTVALILTILVLMYNFFGEKQFMNNFTRITSFNIVRSLQNQTFLPGISWKYAITLFLVTLVVYVCGFSFHRKGIRSFVNLSPNMDSLISLSTNTCYIYSLFMMIYISVISSKEQHSGSPARLYSDKLPNFFDIACILTTISLFGRILDIHSNLLILRIINSDNKNSEDCVRAQNTNVYCNDIKDEYQLVTSARFDSLEKTYYQFSNLESSQVLPIITGRAHGYFKNSTFPNTDSRHSLNTMSLDSVCLDDASPQSPELAEQSSSGENINIDLVDLGDVIVLEKDDIVPFDGIIVSEDISVLDESMITGESRLVEKLYGNFVSSGSRVLSKNIKIFVTEMGSESTLGKIQKLKQKARLNQVELPGIVEKFSKYFIPSIITLSVICFVIWFLLAYLNKVSPEKIITADRIVFFMGFEDIFQKFPISSKVMFALHFSLSVLAISCPCVIGITVPIAILIATSLTSKKNILIQNSKVLSEMCSVDNIIFDKTGTLTNGRPTVKSIVVDYENVSSLSSKFFSSGLGRDGDGNKNSERCKETHEKEHSIPKIETFFISSKRTKETEMGSGSVSSGNGTLESIQLKELAESYLKFWWIIGSCEYYNNHPVGNVLRSYSIQVLGGRKEFGFTQPTDCKYIPGIGMTCKINNMKVLVTSQYKHLDQDVLLVSAESGAHQQYLKSPRNSLDISLDRAEFGKQGSGLNLQSWLKYWSKKGSMIIYIFSEEYSKSEKTAISTKDMKLLGAISMIDEPMFGVQDTIRYLKKFVTDKIWLCSGDSFYTSNSVALMVGIDSDKVMSNSTPNDKLHLVQDLQQSRDLSKTVNIDFDYDLSEDQINGNLFKSLEIECSQENFKASSKTEERKESTKRSKKRVMMIGDGINDSAPIEAADIGILLGKGGLGNFTYADVIILSNYQQNLKFLVKLGR